MYRKPYAAPSNTSNNSLSARYSASANLLSSPRNARTTSKSTATRKFIVFFFFVFVLVLLLLRTKTETKNTKKKEDTTTTITTTTTTTNNNNNNNNNSINRKFFLLKNGEGIGMNPRCREILNSIKEKGLTKTVTRLDLSNCELREIPKEILELENLEHLNLANNRLTKLPNDFSAKLQKLKILFFLKNEFEILPEVLGDLRELFMLSFKSNKVKAVPERSLPKSLGWLILSDNAIERVPASLGECLTMRKLMLAGNKIKELPSFMEKLVNLELLRASDNQIEVFPEWLYSAPKLAWLAFAANPCTEQAAKNAIVRSKSAVKRTVDFSLLGVDETKKLGSGASGAVYRGELDGFNVAVKIYNNMGKTSDGRPEDEMAAASLATSTDDDGGVIETLAKFTTKDTHQNGLVMEFLDPKQWTNLGNPPSFDSVTRDVFDVEKQQGKFTSREILAVAQKVSKGLEQLHANGVCHGDIYAHNILINRDEENPSAKLGDFGAAMFFDEVENPKFAQFIRENEVRAFGCLLDDLLQNYNDVSVNDTDDDHHSKETTTIESLRTLANELMSETRSERPSNFKLIRERLTMIDAERAVASEDVINRSSKMKQHDETK